MAERKPDDPSYSLSRDIVDPKVASSYWDLFRELLDKGEEDQKKSATQQKKKKKKR